MSQHQRRHRYHVAQVRHRAPIFCGRVGTWDEVPGSSRIRPQLMHFFFLGPHPLHRAASPARLTAWRTTLRASAGNTRPRGGFCVASTNEAHLQHDGRERNLGTLPAFRGMTAHARSADHLDRQMHRVASLRWPPICMGRAHAIVPV